MSSANSIFLIILLNGGLICYCHQDIGDVCHITEKNKSGNCKLLKDCKSARVEVSKGKHPQLCGFQGPIPIVCCEKTEQTMTIPKIITTTEANIVRKIGQTAEKKCWEYSEVVYKRIPSPVQLLERTYLNISTCTLNHATLIVGGEDAKELEFPHMALLGFRNNDKIIWLCGGTLISDEFVLTAAHCLKRGNPNFVRLGELNIARTDDSEYQDFNIIEKINHPDYKPPIRYNDIALIKIDRKVTFNKYIRPACLHLTKDILKNRYIATGWGFNHTISNTFTDHLQKVILDKASNEVCNQKHGFISGRTLNRGVLDETQICAGGEIEEMQDTCQGDSGGPLQIYHPQAHCMYSIIGVTSSGKSCGAVGVPGIYTRVSAYIDWIEKNVWP